MSLHTPEQLDELTHRLNSLLELAPCVRRIDNEQAYHETLETLEALLRTAGSDPENPQHLLIEMISRQVEVYEYRTHSVLSQWDQQDGAVALLKTLMRQYSLKQSDLPEIGSQGVVSEILNGKRSLNLSQIYKLAARFGLEPGLFMANGRS